MQLCRKYLTKYAVCKKYLCVICSYAKSRLTILVCSNAKTLFKYAVMQKQNSQICNYAETPWWASLLPLVFTPITPTSQPYTFNSCSPSYTTICFAVVIFDKYVANNICPSPLHTSHYCRSCYTQTRPSPTRTP